MSHTGIEKKTEITPKSVEIELQDLQNPFKKQLESNSASETAFEPPFFRKNIDFLMIFGTQNGAENGEKLFKIRCSKKACFRTRFSQIFDRFRLPK